MTQDELQAFVNKKNFQVLNKREENQIREEPEVFQHF
jgi:hypothetical protein